MTVYIIFVILTAIGIFLHDTNSSKGLGEKIFFCILCVYLILLSGLSEGLGGDKQIYLLFFDNIDTSIPLRIYILEQFEDKSFMPLWSILNYCSCKWFNSFIPVQISLALVLDSAICYLAYKYTNHHFLFLLVLFVSGIFFQLNTEVMREGFAIGLGLLAMESFLEKKWIPYTLLVIAALLFHVSAIMLLFFPIVAILHWNFDWRFLFFCLLGSFAIWFVSDTLLPLLIPKLSFLPSIFLEKIAHYSKEGASLGGYIGLAARYIAVPFIIDHFVLQAESQTDIAIKMQKYMRYQILIGTIICSTGWSFIRLANYSCIFYVICITTFIGLLFTQYKFVITKVLCLLFVIFFQVQRLFMYYPETNAHFYDFFVPYTSVLNTNRPKIDRMKLYDEACPPKDNAAKREIDE